LKVFLVKKGMNLAPAYSSDLEHLNTLKNNVVYRADLKRPRNVKHHKKLFALLNCFIDNQEHYSSVDEILVALKIAYGYIDKVKDFYGNEHVVVKSISFESMSQDDFEPFYDFAINLLANYLGCTAEELGGNIEEYL
jgi:exo-beta-1,3-glucanase (GH17 family)